MDEDRKKQLLMGLIDQELTTEETYEIQEYLRRDQSLRDELERLMETNDQLKQLGAAEFDEAVLRKLWRSPFNKGLRIMSYGLIVGGFLMLAGFAAWELLKNGNTHLFPVVASTGVGIGIIILLLQVIRDRLLVLKNDPYRGIEK